MPLTKIEVRKNWSPDKVQAIIEALYLAQREALQLPEQDRQIRYIEHQSEHFHAPPDKTENYTLIEITLFAGRSLKTKRKLYESIVKRLGLLGIAANDIFIALNEVAFESWGIRGGLLASEVELGFNVKV